MPIAHSCVVEEPRPAPSPRLTGIDVARSIALFGMILVHLVADTAADGSMTLPFILFAGTSSALFAVLAGVGIAFSTGGTRRPKGREWVRAVVQVGTRGVAIGALGLALGAIAGIDADIILAFYGVLFLLSLPLLRLGPTALMLLGFAIAVVMPLVSHVLRQDIGMTPLLSPNFGDLVSNPVATVTSLLLIGPYPALPWLAFICFGLAIGRMNLRGRWVILRLAAAGVVMAAVAGVTSWYLLYRAGGLEALAASAQQSMSLQDFTDYLVWGAEGTLPTDSIWWLALSSAHTATPFDILMRTGIAMAVIGVSVMVCVVAPKLFAPLAVFGSMPLTLYTVHLLMLALPFMPQNEFALVAVHIAVLGAFALVWRAFFARGPLESVLSVISQGAGRLVAGKPPRRQAEVASVKREAALRDSLRA